MAEDEQLYEIAVYVVVSGMEATEAEDYIRDILRHEPDVEHVTVGTARGVRRAASSRTQRTEDP